MQEQSTKELLEKFENGQCSDEELDIIESWYNQARLPSQNKLTEQELTADVSAIYQVLDNVAANSRANSTLWYRFAAAASIIIALAVAVYFMIPAAKQLPIVQNHHNDILPGGNRAVLTLSSGKKIVLTNAKNGQLAKEADASINKTADGKVTYITAGTGASEEIVYNTMATPMGGQYALTLSDGTLVILNAASSIRYPTHFTGTERRVELTGEAYFEVAHNAAMPFHVISKLQDVKVLGTHFNVNCYDDEPATKTTLLEGSVLINGKAKLIPGQQATTLGQVVQVSDADTELAVAWKNNKFMFDNNDITSIMRMISRWYNVKVDYEGPVVGGKFGGSVSRFEKVSEVLNILELTGKVHFKVEGRRITVTK